MSDRLHNIVLLLFVTLSLTACQLVEPIDIPIPSATYQISATPLPTKTRIAPTATLLFTPIPSSTPTDTLVSVDVQSAEFIFIEETVPDGANYQPGQVFHKTWTIKNGGARIWNAEYGLAITSSNPPNETLGSLEKISLPHAVKPGETVEIGVDLTAPEQNGQYTVYYQLVDERDAPVPNSQIWVSVTVGNIPIANNGGISAEFRNASMQAGEFTVNFCMQLPDGHAWYPWNVILSIDQQNYTPSGSRIDPLGATTANKCFSFSFPVLVSSGAIYQLSIGKVELPPEVNQAENCSRTQTTLRAVYPGFDFTCAGPGSWYSNLVLPPGMTTEKADQLILDAMSSSIYGPWLINGSVP